MQSNKRSVYSKVATEKIGAFLLSPGHAIVEALNDDYGALADAGGGLLIGGRAAKTSVGSTDRTGTIVPPPD
ncbi:MAG: hypothetical protein WBW93_13370, partial [Steroidobacteraceae bacterium]